MAAHLEAPCRASAELRRHEQEQAKRFPPNEQRLVDAREEIVEAILSGAGWRGTVLAGVLESYLNVLPADGLYVRLAEISSRLRCLALQPLNELQLVQEGTAAWLREVIAEHIPPSLIEDRAAELAREQ